MRDEDTEEYKAGEKFFIPSVVIAVLIYFITGISIFQAFGVWLLVIVIGSMWYSTVNKGKK
jgi:cytochrome b subunit of formate dehydrogenase